MESLSSWQKRKEKLESERDDLVRKLEVVERDIIKAQAGYGTIYNRNAPVLTLPIEITCLIFREAHLAMEVNRNDDQIRVHLTEVAISHVCRQWRSTAIELPILWSSFHYRGLSATYATLSRFEIYLERSKLHTLELWLDFSQAIRNRALNDALFDMALMLVSRWRLVSICFDEGPSQNTSRTTSLVRHKLKDLHAPQLEYLALYPKLSIEWDEDPAFVSSIGPHIFTEGAPTLKSVRLDTSALGLYLPPLSRVTTLCFEHGNLPVDLVFTLDTFWAILTLPNLENLSISGIFCNSDIEMDSLIPMERLKNLRINDNDTMVLVLQILRAPLLESIMLQNAWIPEGYGDRRNAQDAATYSFPSLTSIVLIDLSCDSQGSLRHFMRITSAARHLTIIHSELYVLDGILGSFDQKSVWPHLKTLVVDFVLLDNGIESALAIFLKSHQRSDPELILCLSDTKATEWKEIGHPQTRYVTMAELCTIEEFPANELLDPKPWPPGGDDILGRRIDTEADPFTIKPKFGFH